MKTISSSAIGKRKTKAAMQRDPDYGRYAKLPPGTKGHLFFYGRSSKNGRTLPELRVFSNFHPAPFLLRGREWPTTEHYFQAAKFFNTEPALAEACRRAASGGGAKKAGWASRNIEPDWNNKRDGVMLDALRAKFGQHPDLAAVLLNTGSALLHEDSPRDYYWGVRGNDRLGKLLMQVRDELRRPAVLEDASVAPATREGDQDDAVAAVRRVKDPAVGGGDCAQGTEDDAQ